MSEQDIQSLATQVNKILRFKIHSSELTPEDINKRLLYMDLVESALTTYDSDEYFDPTQPFSHYRHYFSDSGLKKLQDYLTENLQEFPSNDLLRINPDKLREINGFDNEKMKSVLKQVLQNMERLRNELEECQKALESQTASLAILYKYSVLVFTLAKWLLVLKKLTQKRQPLFFRELLKANNLNLNKYILQLKTTHDAHIEALSQALVVCPGILAMTLGEGEFPDKLFEYSFILLALASRPDEMRMRLIGQITDSFIKKYSKQCLQCGRDDERQSLHVSAVCRISMAISKAHHSCEMTTPVIIHKITEEIVTKADLANLSTDTLANMIYALHVTRDTGKTAKISEIAMQIRKNIHLNSKGMWVWSSSAHSDATTTEITSYAVAVLCFMHLPPDLPLVEHGAKWLLSSLSRNDHQKAPEIETMVLCALVDFILLSIYANEEETKHKQAFEFV